MGAAIVGMALTGFAAVRRHVVQLHRLREAGRAPRRLDGAASDLRFSPARFHRPWRDVPRTSPIEQLFAALRAMPTFL